MGNADLIKTVRGLDQNGIGEDGANLEHLWKSLTSSVDGRFYAAEESSLRWLLKSMNGTTEAAETLRRYPLAWAILGLAFQRLPLFSLAKSLADRRFVHVVHQAVKEASTPVDAPIGQNAGKGKRKRSPTSEFGLEKFQTVEGCVASGSAVFKALNTLLRRLDDTTLSTHDRIGAEHLRSLFSLSAAEASPIVASALGICELLVSKNLPTTDDEGVEEWTETIYSLWALHLHGSDDTIQFASHLYGPAATVLDKLEQISGPHSLSTPNSLKKRWSANLQRFMRRNFILPARSAFLNRQDVEPVVRALEATQQHMGTSIPTLYFLAEGAIEQLEQQGVRKGNKEWMQKLFQDCESFARERSEGAKVILNILKQARKRSAAVSLDDLRSVCRRYALQTKQTDWAIVASVAQCDPDIFQLGDDAEKLLEEICERMLAGDLSDTDFASASEVVDAIIRGFRTARTFPAFLKLWYQQLVRLEDRKSEYHSPWYSIGRDGVLAAFDHAIIEESMSPRQLLDVIEWIEAQESSSQGLSLWLSTVTQGITSEAFKDAVGQQLLDLAMRVKKTSSGLTALKWRVVSRTLSWIPAEQRTNGWNRVQSDIKKILKKSPIESAETYEAFKCSCQAWATFCPDGDKFDEAATLVETFTARLASEVSSRLESGDQQLSTLPHLEANSELQAGAEIQQYISWYLRGSSRLSQLYFKKKGDLIPTWSHLMSAPEARALDVELDWRSILNNEHNLNHVPLAGKLVDRVVNGLNESKMKNDWPGEQGLMWLRLASSIPLDMINRTQREAIMSVLTASQSDKKEKDSMSPESFKLILSLMTKVMSRPTFYKDMHFQHLVDAADAASNIVITSELDVEHVQEMIERYSDFAFNTVRAMADDPERCTPYFTESASFNAQASDAIQKRDAAESPLALRMTLLKALITGLSGSASSSKNQVIVSLLETARQTLGQSIVIVLEEWASDEQFFYKPEPAGDLRLLAAVDAAQADTAIPVSISSKLSRKSLDTRSQMALEAGDMRGWKLQTLLRRHMPSKLQVARPASFPSLDALPLRIRDSVLKDYVTSVIEGMDSDSKMDYLKALIDNYVEGSNTDGQLLAVECVVDQLIGSTDVNKQLGGFDLATAHDQLTRALASTEMTSNATKVCRILSHLMERKPQALSQWNIEAVLARVSVAASSDDGKSSAVSFIWMCKLVEVVIKKHRLRLEGHYHILLNAMQSLLRNLIIEQRTIDSTDGLSQESKAHAFSRLVTLVCEPTAGAVARSQHHNTLDSATDAAKRTAGRHMYLVLMQYVKLQLETDVSRTLREALEPAMNSIFDVTPQEGRKILNDAMDSSGRAILREMFKRYTRFGKWTGV